MPVSRVSVVAVLSLACGATAQPVSVGDRVGVELETGETLRATVVGVSDAELTLDHPVLGTITVPRDRATVLTPEQTDVKIEASQNAEPEVPEAPEPDPESFFDGWDGSFEVALSGSEGNTEEFDVRIGVALERLTSTMETRVNASYLYGTDDGQESENEARLGLINDWLTDTPWRYFLTGVVDYDEFENWDIRTQAFGGVGYALIDDERTDLLLRAGIGGSREFGGSDNKIRPEALLGFNFEHRFNDDHKVYSTFYWLPEIEDIGPYRFEATAGYEILLDADNNMRFRVGLTDSYDSTPNGAKRNDLDYYAGIVFDF